MTRKVAPVASGRPVIWLYICQIEGEADCHSAFESLRCSVKTPDCPAPPLLETAQLPITSSRDLSAFWRSRKIVALLPGLLLQYVAAASIVRRALSQQSCKWRSRKLSRLSTVLSESVTSEAASASRLL